MAESAHTVAVSGWVGSSVLESVLRLGGGICDLGSNRSSSIPSIDSCEIGRSLEEKPEDERSPNSLFGKRVGVTGDSEKPSFVSQTAIQQQRRVGIRSGQARSNLLLALSNGLNISR